MSGTADVVEYAKSLGKPVLIIDAITLEVRRKNFNKLDRTGANLMVIVSLIIGTAGATRATTYVDRDTTVVEREPVRERIVERDRF